MTFATLSTILSDSRLFGPIEICRIVKTCGMASIANVGAACLLLGIDISLADIRTLYAIAHNH